MINKIRVIPLVLFVSLFLMGCDSFSNQLGIITPGQTEAAKNRINDMSVRIPKVPGAIHIQKVETMGDSRDAICINYYLISLYGTNDITYTEVMYFYRSSSPSWGWKPLTISNETQEYAIDNGIVITIGKNYGYEPFTGTLFGEGGTKFKTVFLITLRTPIVRPYPEHCLHREGG